MATVPTNPVRNRFGPQGDNLQIAYVATNIAGDKLKNLGKGFASSDSGATSGNTQSAWDGTLVTGSVASTVVNSGEGKVLNMPGSSTHVNVGASLTGTRAFIKGTILYRFVVDSAGGKAQLLNNGIPIGSSGTFAINYSTAPATRQVVWRTSVPSSETTYLDTNDPAGLVQSLIITWDETARKVYTQAPVIPNTADGLSTRFGEGVIVAAADQLRLFQNDISAAIVGQLYIFSVWDKVLTSSERAELFSDPYLPVRRTVKSSLPRGSRGTFIQTSSDPTALQTQWEFSGFGNTFTITTDANGVVGAGSGNVLDSTATVNYSPLDTLNIWLPLFSEYQLKTRQVLSSGVMTEWTDKVTVVARGLVNSAENYAILNANTMTIA